MILNLFDRMKLPFRKSKEFLKALYDILGFYPHDIEIYRIAFSHKSLTYRRDRNATDKRGNNRDKRNRPDAPTKPLNNERLEYLGDAVLETVVSDILFRHFSNKREGFLTSTRSKIVQREALNRLASQMGLETLIQAAQGTRMVHTNIGGNAFEALMGAIYLDRGYKFCHWFIENRVIGHYVDLDSVAQKEVNFKSKLLEWCQKNRINTNFRDSVNNESERGFRSTIVLEGITVGKGTGRSKKESQQVAAKDALTRMRKEQKLYDSIFRAKEKRTAMEADESFALPKIDEIENIISKDEKKRKPVLEGKPSEADENDVQQLMDSAYDEAYNEQADFEVIGNAEDESEYSEYATDIQPDATAEEVELSARTQPTAVLPEKKEEGERPAPMTKAQRRRERNRSAKTVDDAVKNGSRKGKAVKVEKQTVTDPQEVSVQSTDKEKKDNPKANDRPNRKERAQAQEPKEPKSDHDLAKRQPKQDVPDESTVEKDTDELITLQATILEDTEPTKAKHNGPVVNRVITGEDLTEVETAERLSPTDIIPTEKNVPSNESEVRPDIEEVAERVSYLARKCVLDTMHEDVLPLVDITSPTDLPEETPSTASHTSAEETEDEGSLHQEDKSEESVTIEDATEDSTIQREEDTVEEIKDNDNGVEVVASEAETSNETTVENESEYTKPDDVHEAETEEPHREEQAEEQEQLPSSVTGSEAARPILRHLTLDDFVFGTTDATMDDVDAPLPEGETEEETLHDNKPRRSKSRRRRRKPQSQQDTDNTTDSDSQEEKTSQPRKRKPQQSKSTKSETEKQGKTQSDDSAESSMNEAEKTAKRKAAQRRRRRRENGNGKDTVQQAE